MIKLLCILPLAAVLAAPLSIFPTAARDDRAHGATPLDAPDAGPPPEEDDDDARPSPTLPLPPPGQLR